MDERDEDVAREQESVPCRDKSDQSDGLGSRVLEWTLVAGSIGASVLYFAIRSTALADRIMKALGHGAYRPDRPPWGLPVFVLWAALFCVIPVIVAVAVRRWPRPWRICFRGQRPRNDFFLAPTVGALGVLGALGGSNPWHSWRFKQNPAFRAIPKPNKMIDLRAFLLVTI